MAVCFDRWWGRYSCRDGSFGAKRAISDAQYDFVSFITRFNGHTRCRDMANIASGTSTMVMNSLVVIYC